jgi:hypothetical protein
MEKNIVILAIVGGRDYNDYNTFKTIVDNYINEITPESYPDFIVSGGAKGVDSLAENYALEHNISMKIYKPDWSKGKRAGLERNTDIINISTHVLALPTKNSRGTYDSINKAKQQNKILKIVNV